MTHQKIQLVSGLWKKNIFVLVEIVLVTWLLIACNPAAQSISTPPPAAGQPTPVPEQINFKAGATSAMVKGDLHASGSDLYALRALRGQTMMVELSFTEGQANLVIWGEDGTILFSDHAEVTDFRSVLDHAELIHFQGILPSTQDYFILLQGRPDGSTSYSMGLSLVSVSTGTDDKALQPEKVNQGETK